MSTLKAAATRMAVVHRPNDIGIDLPPGASAGELQSTDYHPVEIANEAIAPATVDIPGECGVDLPAGASAGDLVPTDYRIVEVGGAPKKE